MGLQAFVSVIRIAQGQGRHSMNMWQLHGLGGEVTVGVEEKCHLWSKGLGRGL